ncbi:MAG: sulfotransferase family protein [Planctomycetales bacterium]|nr:sulfotransferase family protein [Planctomycetales bacterium]
MVYCPIEKVGCSSLKMWWADLLEGGTDPYFGKNEFGQTTNFIDHGGLNKSFRLQNQSRQLARRPLTEEGWFRFVFVRNPWSRLVSAFVNKFPMSHQCLGSQELVQPVFQAVHRRWKRNPLMTAGRVVSQSPSLLSVKRGLRMTLLPLLQGAKAWSDEMTFRHFIEFLRTQHLDSDNSDLHWRPQYRFLGSVSFHFIGRFERLGEDLRTISHLLGIKAKLPALNATNYAKEEAVPADCFADAPLSQLRSLAAIPCYRKFYTRELQQQVADLYRRDIEQFGYDFDG